jgi:hypothetical protein
MKKSLMVVLALLMCLSFASAVLAQEGGGQEAKQAFNNKMNAAKVKTFAGEVVSHDVACHCVVVKQEKGTLTLQDDYSKFEQEYNKAKGLKIGQKVKGTYKTVDYINYALTFESVN